MNVLEWIGKIFTNPFALTALFAWGIAQIIKSILFLIINKKFDPKRLVGDGGMPSGHSATVTSLCVISALTRGPASFEFAVTFVLAIIACHDATGVRLETEKQAFLLTEIVNTLSEIHKEKIPEVKLKKFVGHTPIQVAAGVLLGAAVAVGMYFWMF